jgi:hypothetical protein
MGMTEPILTLGQVVGGIEGFSDGGIIFVPDDTGDVSLSSPVKILDLDSTLAGVPGFRYFLEVELVKDVLQVWSDWRDGQSPTLDESLAAIIYYAANDSYIPIA